MYLAKGQRWGLPLVRSAHVQVCTTPIDLWSVSFRWAELYGHTHKEKYHQTHQRTQPLLSFHLFLPSLIEEFLFFSPANWLVKDLLVTDFLSKMRTRCSSTVKWSLMLNPETFMFTTSWICAVLAAGREVKPSRASRRSGSVLAVVFFYEAN